MIDHFKITLVKNILVVRRIKSIFLNLHLGSNSIVPAAETSNKY